jgi:hypothetical protein
MLLDGLVIELQIVLLLGRLAEGGIEDLLFEGGVDLELALDFLQELFTSRGRLLRALLELAEERTNLGVIFLEQTDGVLHPSAGFGSGHR